MNSKANLADNLLLLGVIGVLAVVAFGLLAAIVGTILFAIKVIIVVVAITFDTEARSNQWSSVSGSGSGTSAAMPA